MNPTARTKAPAASPIHAPDPDTIEPIDELRERLAEADAQISGLESRIAALVERLSDPAQASEAERELAGAEASLRYRRGARTAVAQQLALAEARERAVAQRPQRERLDTLVHVDLPAKVSAFRAALEAALSAGQAVADHLHQTGETAQAAGHQRWAELQHPDSAAMAAGTPGRLALPFCLFGIAYQLSPSAHSGDRMLSLAALDRLVADVEAIVSNETNHGGALD